MPSPLNFPLVEYLFYLPYGIAVPTTRGGTELLFTAWRLEEGKQILALLKAFWCLVFDWEYNRHKQVTFSLLKMANPMLPNRCSYAPTFQTPIKREYIYDIQAHFEHKVFILRPITDASH